MPPFSQYPKKFSTEGQTPLYSPKKGKKGKKSKKGYGVLAPTTTSRKPR